MHYILNIYNVSTYIYRYTHHFNEEDVIHNKLILNLNNDHFLYFKYA